MPVLQIFKLYYPYAVDLLHRFKIVNLLHVRPYGQEDINGIHEVRTAL